MRSAQRVLLALIVTAASAAVCFEAASTPINAASIYVYDGDTIIIDGRRLRLEGVDSPEIGKSRCDYERQIGFAARDRLREMIAQAGSLVLADTGKIDRYRRPLIRLRIDGRDGGEMLISEGLAVEWKTGAAAWEWRARHWCG